MNYVVGKFDNEEVIYNPITDIVSCKTVNIYLRSLISFVESDKIRMNLDSKTSITKKESTYKIGCLEDSTKNLKELIKKGIKLKQNGKEKI